MVLKTKTEERNFKTGLNPFSRGTRNLILWRKGHASSSFVNLKELVSVEILKVCNGMVPLPLGLGFAFYFGFLWEDIEGLRQRQLENLNG